MSLFDNLKPRDSDEEFGPNPDAGTEDVTPLKTAKREPKPAPRRVAADKKPLGRPSSVRKLNDDDKEKIITFYTFASAGVMPFHQGAAQAMALSADTCAAAWMELANENVSVRKTILRIIEGGAWGGVIAAHLPIIMAIIPRSALPFPFPMFDQGEENGAA